MVISLVDSALVLLLLSHNINLLSERPVFSLEVVELGESFVELVFIDLSLVVVPSHLGSGWSDLL